MSSEVGSPENLSSNSAGNQFNRTLSPKKCKEKKYGTGGGRSGTILLKPDRIHWNAIFHQEWG
jgi:hypothetical protein